MQKFEIGDRVRVRDDVDTSSWEGTFVREIVKKGLGGIVIDNPGDYPFIEWEADGYYWHNCYLGAQHLEKGPRCLTA